MSELLKFSDTPGADLEIGRCIKVDDDQLGRYCFRRLHDVEIDALLVASMIGWADRRVRRKGGWARDMRVTLPVHDPSAWAPAGAALKDCVTFMTGDRWEFTFVARRHPDDHASRLPLLPFASPHVDCAMPYSGGLDSLAAFSLAVDRPEGLVLVTSEHAARVRRAAIDSVADSPKVARRIGVPIGMRRLGKHAEETYRTRTFLFFVAAALGARLVKAERVEIAENGQGSLGPSLVPTGNEHPFRATHPGFTLRLRRFLTALWGDCPRFHHPYLWSTKAEVLRDAVERRPDAGWTTTWSCSRGSRRQKGTLGKKHCGVCGNCLLRRLALAEVGLDEAEPYYWHDLSRPTLAETVLGDATTETGDADQDVAACGVLDLQRLGMVRADTPALARVSHELDRALEISDSRDRLLSLVERHRAEWDRFLARRPQGSWLRNVAGSIA